MDFAALERGEALHAEFFHREASQHGTVNHRVAQCALVHFPRARQIAHETAGETVACAGGILHFFQRKCRHRKQEFLVHHDGAVLAALDHQGFRAHFEDFFGSARQVVLAGELASFVVIDHQHLDMFQRFLQLSGRTLDPVVHGVQTDDLRFARDLLQHGVLQRRIDVAQKNKCRVRVRFRQRRLEICEDIEVRSQSRALVHVLVVAPGPIECFPLGAFQALQINVLVFEDGHIFSRKIIADNSHQAHRREVTGGQREIAGGAAQKAIVLAVRSFNAIESHRADH